MLKNIAAGIAGVVIAGVFVWLVEMVGHSVYPPPPNLDFADADAMRAYIDRLPLGALLFVAAAWFIGTLGGTFSACKIGTAKPIVFAGVVGGLMLLGTAANLIMIPHPLWFSILGIVGIIVAAWLGMTLGAASSSSSE
ncbi:MAG: hypothetical protein KJO27_14975 [Gammaproteobacteria bacterium]|nr:hypothetical protein [Gammaproteobacteria bacterium]NND47609.1 hypothetical protein [Woeseiaceae bacterium]NNL46719.1 hypothetical protein [Woeseiaceae bacterium]